MPTPPSAALAVSPEVAAIEQDLNRITHLSTRGRQHDRLMALAGVSLDRAAVALLRLIADAEPMRPGELAGRLGVEASHVTRQVQRLQKPGYVVPVVDPADRRARRIQLTAAGRDATDRIRDAGARGMQMVLADWSPEELCHLSLHFNRMLDVFLSSTDDDPRFEAGSDAPAL